MGFFNRKQKRLARKMTEYELIRKYKESENKLKEASKLGKEKELKKAMREHGNCEYALLYRNTPEFNKKIKKYK